MKLCPIKVGDLISSKGNLGLIGVVTGLSLNQGVFWVRWLDREINTIYSTRNFDTMFAVVARA